MLLKRFRILCGAATHMLPSSEFIKLFADVRFGIALGIVKDISYEQLGTLLVETMPATLTLSAEHPPKTGAARDILRAKVVKDILKPDTNRKES